MALYPPGNPAWYRQHVVAWANALVCGVRAESMGTLPEHPSNCLRWSDIKLRVIVGDDQIPSLALTVTFRHLRGRLDPHTRASDGCGIGVTFLALPCTKAANVVANITWLLPAQALSLRLLGPATIALDELLAIGSAVIAQASAVTNEAVSLAGHTGKEGLDSTRPLSLHHITSTLQEKCRKVGIHVYESM